MYPTPPEIPSSRVVDGLARRPSRRLSDCVLRLVWMVFFTASLWCQAASGPTEYEVKAALLFKFAKFTAWPATAFTNNTAPLVIGVVGEDPFGEMLDAVVAGESVDQRPLVVKRFKPGQDLSAAHLLFVSRSEADRLSDLLADLKQKPVLTVSDTKDFCELDGMIRLSISRRGSLKLEANPGSALASGVRISSKLLNLPMVKIVKTNH